MPRKQVIIYTDGACSGNPGMGGWAAVLKYGDIQKELSGYEKETTNNRMELMAAICGLQTLKMPCDVTLHTDSAYLHDAFVKHWLDGWRRNNWLKKDKTPVLNRDLWEELLRLCAIHDVTWVKVKGHADDEFNNLCDSLARAAILAGRKG